MKTEYQISGSTPVTLKVKGGVHEMLTDEEFLKAFKSLTAESKPENIVYICMRLTIVSVLVTIP